jgi:hypothetical protein
MTHRTDDGPNTAQVKRFIARLKGLTRGEWKQLLAERDAARAAYGDPDWDEIERECKTAKAQVWGDSETRALLTAIKSETSGSEALHIAVGAVMALATCTVITPEQFAAAYGPFTGLVPVDSLGNGLAPPVARPPATLYGRFITRLRSLTTDWDQVIDIALVRNAALENSVVNDAGLAALEALQSLVEDGGLELECVQPILQALEAVEGTVDQGFGAAKEGWKLIGNKLGESAYWSAAKYADRYGWKEEGARLVSKDALFALITRELITPQQFAILYLPFAGAIPIHSLEVGQ